MTVRDDDNGSLGRIPAEFIGCAIDRMPDPHTLVVRSRATAVFEVLELGDLRITAELKRNPRWKQYRCKGAA